MQVDLDLLLAAVPDEPLQATPVSTFPVAKEDLAFVVDADVPAGHDPGRPAPLVVLLHGAGDNARDWSYVLPLLARSHRVFAPDLPGYSPASTPAHAHLPVRAK